MINKSSGGPKSSQSKRQNQRRNTQTGRDTMSSSNFALPKGSGSQPDKDQYRIDDRAHAANAKARVEQHGTPSEKRTVRRKVADKYPSLADDKPTGGGKSGRSKKRKS